MRVQTLRQKRLKTALATAQSAGNSLTVTGLEANIIALADQDNGGTVRSTVDADIANANWGVTAMSEASGNTASIQNESGYGHLQGSQNNRGEVRATTTLAVGTFGDGPVTGSSHAVGNNALVSNIGADAYSGVSQNNSGAGDRTGLHAVGLRHGRLRHQLCHRQRPVGLYLPPPARSGWKRR